MATILTAALSALLLFAGAASAVVLTQILRLRWLEPKVEPLSPLEVPDDARELLAPGLELLLALGFVQPAAQRMVAQAKNGKPIVQHLLTLTHPKVPAAAFLTSLVRPDGPRHWTLHFVSRTRAGQTLLTRNRAGLTGPVPLKDVTTNDLWLPDWPALWKSHVAAMRGLAGSASDWVGLSSVAWARASADADVATFHVRQMQKQLVWARGGGFRVSWAWGLTLLGRGWLKVHHSARSMAADRFRDKSTPPSMSALVSSYERYSRQPRLGAWSTGAKWLMFFAAAGATALSFGLQMDWPTLGALLTVLLVHEGGHFVAMRWAGYQDPKVFILPLLGAAFSGQHGKPTIRQELVVLFAGPLPGLVLGLLTLLYVPAETLGDFGRSCALLAVILNAFNLLPIHPLDGGRVFEILLLPRWPWLAFAGRVLGLLALGALALALDSAWALGVTLAFVVLMVLGLPQHWREARIAKALRASGRHQGLERPAALRALFSTIAQLGYSRLPWPSQRLLVDTLLPATLRPRITRSARVAGLVFYAFSLALPLLGAVAWGQRLQQVGEDAAMAAELQQTATVRAESEAAGRAAQAVWQRGRHAELQALHQRVAAAQGAEAKWALLEPELGQVAEDLARSGGKELAAAEGLLRQADSLAAAADATPARRAQAALWRAEASVALAERQRLLRAAMAAYDTAASAPTATTAASGAAAQASSAAQLGPLLRATTQWAQELAIDRPADVAEQVDKVLAQAADSALPQELAALQTLKVDLLLAAGQGDQAVALANAVFDRAVPRGDPVYLAISARLLVEATLAANGPEAALMALDTALPLLDVMQSPGQTPAEPLRRFGLWLAEAAKRSDWQGAQVAKLAPRSTAPTPVSFKDRAVVWLITRGQSEATTLLDVERAHWSGQPEAAREAAQQLLARNPRLVVPLWPTGPGVGAMAAARATATNGVRRAAYERYGLKVTMAR